jgi:hypothetical protein
VGWNAIANYNNIARAVTKGGASGLPVNTYASIPLLATPSATTLNAATGVYIYISSAMASAASATFVVTGYYTGATSGWGGLSV